MNQLPLHPLLVHLPIALAVLMPLVSAGLLVAWWKGVLPRRAWAVAVLLQGALVVSGLVALRTGEADEERIESVVAEAPIEAHEEAAQVFVAGSAAVLALGIAAAALRNERRAQAAAVVATMGTVLVLGLGYRTGEAGGRLVYEHGAASAYATPSTDTGALPHDD